MLKGLIPFGLLFPAAIAASVDVSAAPPTPPVTPPVVRSVAQGHGWTFTDLDGRTLYKFAEDEKEKGGSRCNEDCAAKWPPLPASDSVKSIGSWSTIARQDGSLQWAFRGAPVYRYAKDPAPGTTYGDFDWDWSVVLEPIPLPPGVTMRKTLRGYVASNERQLTLYARTAASECNSKCRDSWIPLKAPQLANAIDEWGIVSAPDGTRQWTYKDKPLFHFIGDVQPGETTGASEDWKVVVLSPPPPRPAWVSIQGTDAGEMFADQQHLVIYAYGAESDHLDNAKCDGVGCRDWRARLAEGADGPIGDWGIVVLPDGKRQWTFKGRRLFASNLDRWPGDFRGIRFNSDRSFRVLMALGDQMQGMNGDGN